MLAAGDRRGRVDADLIALDTASRGAEVDRRSGHGEIARLIPLRPQAVVEAVDRDYRTRWAHPAGDGAYRRARRTTDDHLVTTQAQLLAAACTVVGAQHRDQRCGLLHRPLVGRHLPWCRLLWRHHYREVRVEYFGHTDDRQLIAILHEPDRVRKQI